MGIFINTQYLYLFIFSTGILKKLFPIDSNVKYANNWSWIQKEKWWGWSRRQEEWSKGNRKLENKPPTKPNYQPAPDLKDMNVGSILFLKHTKLQSKGSLDYFYSVHSNSTITFCIQWLMEVHFDVNMVRIAIAMENTREHPDTELLSVTKLNEI